jgi:hypothetical protein
MSHIEFEPAIPDSKWPLNTRPVIITPFYWLYLLDMADLFLDFLQFLPNKILIFTELGIKVMPVETPHSS